MAFNPNRPFNDLPDLPSASETETRAVLRSCIVARAALAKLRVSGDVTYSDYPGGFYRIAPD